MDPLSLLLEGDPTQADARALAEAYRRRQGLGSTLAFAGNPRLAQAGQRIQGDAAGQVDQILQALTQRRIGQQQQAQNQRLAQSDAADRAMQGERLNLDRLRLAMEGRRIEQDAFSAVADPVTGGIVLYNRKTGQTMPLGPGGGTPGQGQQPAGTPPLLPGKPTENQRKAVAGAAESLTLLDKTIESVKAAPGAYGGAGNFAAAMAEQVGGTPVQSLTAKRYTPDELRAKNLVSNVVSKIINERAGANVTYREELRQKFLPQDTDGYEQALQKLMDLRDSFATTYEAQSGGALQAPPPVSPPPPPPGATHYSPSTGKFYDAQGNEVAGAAAP